MLELEQDYNDYIDPVVFGESFDLDQELTGTDDNDGNSVSLFHDEPEAIPEEAIIDTVAVTAVNVEVEPIKQVVGMSKAQKAKAVFNAQYGKLQRKDIIALFKGDDIGLTTAGASTYYQQFTTKLKANGNKLPI